MLSMAKRAICLCLHPSSTAPLPTYRDNHQAMKSRYKAGPSQLLYDSTAHFVPWSHCSPSLFFCRWDPNPVCTVLLSESQLLQKPSFDGLIQVCYSTESPISYLPLKKVGMTTLPPASNKPFLCIYFNVYTTLWAPRERLFPVLFITCLYHWVGYKTEASTLSLLFCKMGWWQYLPLRLKEFRAHRILRALYRTSTH